jgi:VanZ family protein
VIIGLGSGLGASGNTSRFIRPLIELLFPAATPETIAFYHGLIRKGAHVVEYAVLGMLATRAFRLARSFGKNSALFAIAFVTLVAGIDEFNQSFNPQRTGTIYDVFIDLGGGVTGVLIAFTVNRRMER